MTLGELWEIICRRREGKEVRGGGRVGKDVNSIKNTFMCVLKTERHRKSGQKVLNKPQMRLLLKIPGGTFL